MISFHKDSFLESNPCLKKIQGDWASKVLGDLSMGQSPDSIPPENFNGRFLAAAFNSRTKELHVWTDRFGTIHAYYAFNGKRGAVGTSFKEVSNAASAKKKDWLGIGGFLRFGFFPDDRTYFEDVKILKPASEYIFSADGKLLSEKRYWNWRHEPDSKRTYEETVDEFARIFHQVISEQVSSGRTAVPISGGLDSRSTVAALENINADKNLLWSYSYGYSNDSVETKIARQIAAEAGLKFQSFTIQPYLFKKIDEVVNAVEGFQDMLQARQSFVTDEIRKHADSVLCAHWGDVWMDSLLKNKTLGTLPMTQAGLTEIIFNKFKKRGSDELLNLFKERIPQDLDAQLKSLIFKKLEDLNGVQSADFKIKSFKTDWWSFRWTLTSIRVFEAAAKPLLPFYDERIADFFMTVPDAYMSGRRLQIDYLKKYAPGLAKIKWQAYDADLYGYKNFNTWHLPKRFFNKITRFFSVSKKHTRNWEVQLLGPGARGNFEQLLKNSSEIKEIVSEKRLEKAVSDFYENPNPVQGYVSSMVLTLASALERMK